MVHRGGAGRLASLSLRHAHDAARAVATRGGALHDPGHRRLGGAAPGGARARGVRVEPRRFGAWRSRGVGRVPAAGGRARQVDQGGTHRRRHRRRPPDRHGRGRHYGGRRRWRPHPTGAGTAVLQRAGPGHGTSATTPAAARHEVARAAPAAARAAGRRPPRLVEEDRADVGAPQDLRVAQQDRRARLHRLGHRRVPRGPSQVPRHRRGRLLRHAARRRHGLIQRVDHHPPAPPRRPARAARLRRRIPGAQVSGLHPLAARQHLRPRAAQLPLRRRHIVEDDAGRRLGPAPPIPHRPQPGLAAKQNARRLRGHDEARARWALRRHAHPQARRAAALRGRRGLPNGLRAPVVGRHRRHRQARLGGEAQGRRQHGPARHRARA